MPLYLDSIWLNASSRESALRGFAAFRDFATQGAYPPGVTVKAGPWFSNEEAKVVLVLDIADHAATFPAFASAVAGGIVLRRRLEPIVEPADVDRLLEALRS